MKYNVMKLVKKLNLGNIALYSVLFLAVIKFLNHSSHADFIEQKASVDALQSEIDKDYYRFNNPDFFARIEQLEKIFDKIQTIPDREYYNNGGKKFPLPVKNQWFNQEIRQVCEYGGYVDALMADYGSLPLDYYSYMVKHNIPAKEYPFEYVFMNNLQAKCDFWMAATTGKIKEAISNTFVKAGKMVNVDVPKTAPDIKNLIMPFTYKFQAYELYRNQGLKTVFNPDRLLITN